MSPVIKIVLIIGGLVIAAFGIAMEFIYRTETRCEAEAGR